MLRITKETDYGILFLTCFAKNKTGVPLTTKQLAQQTGIPYRMVCKILNMLTRKGLLHSHRGVKGGYDLVKSADQITLEDAILAIEGPISLTECTKEVCDCTASEKCSVQDHWLSINQAFRKALQGITILNMSAPKTNLFPFFISGGQS